jgi:hypothetical protein
MNALARTRILGLALLFVLGIQPSRAQEEFPRSGIGVLVPDKGISSLHINFPLAEFELFDAPAGKPVGKLWKKNSLNLVYSVAAGQTYRVADDDLTEFQKMGFCLKIFASEKGYVKVLENSTGKGYWLSVKEINYLRFQPKIWLDLLINLKQVCVPVVDMGVNLRKQPKTGDNKILLVKGSRYGIVFTGATEDLWAEVTVKRFGKTPCRKPESNEKALEEWTGWIKVIDDSGVPNVWLAPDCE